MQTIKGCHSPLIVSGKYSFPSPSSVFFSPLPRPPKLDLGSPSAPQLVLLTAPQSYSVLLSTSQPFSALPSPIPFFADFPQKKVIFQIPDYQPIAKKIKKSLKKVAKIFGG